ncbi:MAG: hypothetical protein Q4E32_07190 [Bacteroidales bacterium]|nr:hypothetical protein [Bacteroidales bacterium]
MKTRRIAATQIILPDGSKHRQHVVELIGTRVVSVYPLQGEMSHTEWYSGTVVIEADRLWLLQTLADGTQHKRLL